VLAGYLRRFGGFQRDARIFLGTTLVGGVAGGLFWIDFNLYLAALGLTPAEIGLVATAGSVAGVVAAFPAARLSDHTGRRLVLALGLLLQLAATIGLLMATALPHLALLALLYGAGQQAYTVVVSPFLTEHSRPEERNELFALQFALTSLTTVLAAAMGTLTAAAAAALWGTAPDSVATFRLIVVVMALFLAGAVVTVAFLSDDRPRREASAPPTAPRSGPQGRPRIAGLRLDVTRRFVRLLIPGFLISVGAGQLIPFLNLYLEGKFGLSVAALNAAFGLTSLGTVVAVLAQPALARRRGKVASVVVVQAASLPFLAILGFAPWLPAVLAALVVRNALMNAGNPIQTAFAMEILPPRERASYSAASNVLWSVGWLVGGPLYSLLQASLGFSAGYTAGFVLIIVLYSVATWLFWVWFHEVEGQGR